jgi:hypothetical protein
MRKRWECRCFAPDLTTVPTTVTTVAVPATPPTRLFAADHAWLLRLPAPGSVVVTCSSSLLPGLTSGPKERLDRPVTSRALRPLAAPRWPVKANCTRGEGRPVLRSNHQVACRPHEHGRCRPTCDPAPARARGGSAAAPRNLFQIITDCRPLRRGRLRLPWRRSGAVRCQCRRGCWPAAGAGRQAWACHPSSVVSPLRLCHPLHQRRQFVLLKTLRPSPSHAGELPLQFRLPHLRAEPR